MNRFVQKLRYVKIGDILSFFTMLSAYPYAMILKKKRPHIWLFCEDRNEARDNGFWLYRYTCRFHPETDAVYAIEMDSQDLEKVRQIGREVIPWGGIRHWAYYLAAEKNISTQKDGKPNAALCYLLEVYGIRKNKRAFLQHGITHNDVEFLYYKNTKMSLFVCGARKEYEFIKSKFGYPEGAVKLLGLARYDGLHNFSVKEKQILIMPTWRKDIATPGRFDKRMDSADSFVRTEYYLAWKGLLDDLEFQKMIRQHHLQVIFYPHRCMQRFLHLFRSDDSDITTAGQVLQKSGSDHSKSCRSGTVSDIPDLRDAGTDGSASDWSGILLADSAHYDVQELLRESAFLITDYSSIAMDFAYMSKPLLYYQFDKEAFFSRQYGKGYFSYEEDGFGPVEYELSGVREAVRKAIESGFQMEDQYRKRRNEFFELDDSNNCERNYQAILEM